MRLVALGSRRFAPMTSPYNEAAILDATRRVVTKVANGALQGGQLNANLITLNYIRPLL